MCPGVYLGVCMYAFVPMGPSAWYAQVSLGALFLMCVGLVSGCPSMSVSVLWVHVSSVDINILVPQLLCLCSGGYLCVHLRRILCPICVSLGVHVCQYVFGSSGCDGV